MSVQQKAGFQKGQTSNPTGTRMINVVPYRDLSTPPILLPKASTDQLHDQPIMTDLALEMADALRVRLLLYHAHGGDMGAKRLQ